MRNRARVLAVAEEIFADRGVSASTEEIARQAGVGIGTVFRHFPTKEALLEAVFVGRLRRLADDAAGLAGAADPGVAFFDFFGRVVQQSATKNAFADALTRAGIDVTAPTVAVRQELNQALSLLLRRAQQAGAVRTDIGPGEMRALLVGAARAAENAGADPSTRARVLGVIMDGLRTADPDRG